MKNTLKALSKALASNTYGLSTGDVIRFVAVATDKRRYTYACVYAGNGLWYFTGGRGFFFGQGVSTEALLRTLRGRAIEDVELATTWEPLEG